MTSSKKSSALDDLMLAYTDLSGNNKKSDFKGPPVKDIRREAPKQVFQHSTKARDWRAFDQSLESVFGSSSPSGGSGGSGVSGGSGGSGGSGQTVPTVPTLLPAPSPVVAPAASSEGQDDWGEFQQFSSSQSVGCR